MHLSRIAALAVGTILIAASLPATTLSNPATPYAGAHIAASAACVPQVIHHPAPGAPLAALKSLGANVRLPEQLQIRRPAPIYRPVPDNSGGAAGPFLQSMRKLSSKPDPFAGLQRLPSFPILPPNTNVVLPPPANVVQATDSASYSSCSPPAYSPPGKNFVAHSITPNSIFGSGSSTDIDATTDGNYVVTTASRTTASSNDFTGYNYQNGAVVFNESELNFFCNGNHLPVCSTGATPGDGRVAYDIGSGRWIVSVLFDNGNNTRSVGLAFSVTSDPRGNYYLYQVAACDATENNIDQPHLGFNDRWIVVSSSCPVRGQPGLMVIDKCVVYNGRPLYQGQNFFKIVDPADVSTSYRDDPTRTYTVTYGDREYLVESVLYNGYAATEYSYLDGNTDSPALHSATAYVRSIFPARLLGLSTPVSEPGGCNYCLNYESYSVIHSSTVNSTYPNGYPAIYATAAYQDTDPRYTNRTQIVSTAVVETTNVSRAIQVPEGGNGDGPMASEIAIPYYGTGVNLAMLGYARSDPYFYPGVQYAEWNVDTDGFTFYSRSLAQGNHDPARCGGNCDGDRWIDFLDGAAPVPGSSQVFLSGSFSSGSTYDRDRSNIFAPVSL